MEDHSVGIGALAAYVEHETELWRAWFAAAPAGVLDLSLGPGAGGTVRELVKHIFAVELRYAQRLVGHPATSYEKLDDGSVEALWRIHRTARAIRDRYLAGATAPDLARTLAFETRRLGRLQSTAHGVVVHALVHSIRHWAQLATVLRQHGHGGLWEHDWLMSPVVGGRG